MVSHVLVVGGSGFVGRHVVEALCRSGVRVRVASRQAARFSQPQREIGQVSVLNLDLTRLDARALDEACADGVDAIVNLAGILTEHRQQVFAKIHIESARALAHCAARRGFARFIHMSALGADAASPSAYARSKAAGEEAVRQEAPFADVLRPSVIFGAGDHFLARFGRMAASLLPFMPVAASRYRLQPIHVSDVADVINFLLKPERPRAVAPGVHELGGPEVFTWRELMESIVRMTGRSKFLLPLPDWVVGLVALSGEVLPSAPLTLDQFRLLRSDNVVSNSESSLSAFGLRPRSFSDTAAECLAAWSAPRPLA